MKRRLSDLSARRETTIGQMKRLLDERIPGFTEAVAIAAKKEKPDHFVALRCQEFKRTLPDVVSIGLAFLYAAKYNVQVIGWFDAPSAGVYPIQQVFPGCIKTPSDEPVE